MAATWADRRKLEWHTAAERLGISRWQAYKLARSGRLPTTRLGARDLHVPAAVLRRIEQEGLPPAPEGGEVA